MRTEDIQMMEQVMDTETVGYAYVYPGSGEAREEYLVALTAENLANLVGSRGAASKEIIVTDVLDRLIVNVKHGILDACPNQELCSDMIGFLAPLQRGEKEPGEVLSVSRDAAEEYFAAEDAAATMAEYQMEW
mgnify:CR=1 FL=1